jgi:hypothetical protein
VAKLHFSAADSSRTAPYVTDTPKSTYKKVVVRRLDHELIKGFVDSASYLKPNAIEMLDREGRALTVSLAEIKGVFFVREFDGNSQRSERKLFQSRPRMAGLWVQMTFKDQEILEGLLSGNLIEFSPDGFLLTPADLYSNNLKIFVPRSALNDITVLGVIPDRRVRELSQRRGARPRETAASDRQIGLFAAQEEKKL